MRLNKVSGVMAGLAAGIVLGGSITALAASGLTSIQVNMMPVHFIINGVDKTPANGQFDNQGVTVPDGFIYDGTTYVPIRLMATLLGQPVSWDGPSHAVKVGIPPTGVYLEDTVPMYYTNGDSIYDGNLKTEQGTVSWNWGNPGFFNDSNLWNASSVPTMAGTSYPESISMVQQVGNGNTPKFVWNLNGQYKSLTFMLGLDDQDNGGPVQVQVLGDGTQLLETTLNPGQLPVQENLNVTGVGQLEVALSDIQGTQYSTSFVVVDMGNPLLTP